MQATLKLVGIGQYVMVGQLKVPDDPWTADSMW